MTRREEILDGLESITDIPSLPEVISKVDEVMNSSNASAASVADIINDDPAITLKVIKLANSPLFTVGRTIDDVRQAVVQLGFREVRNLVLALSSINIMRNLNNIDYRKFWQHSITVGFATRALAGFYKKEELDDKFLSMAFTAGLLHDIGILVLDQFFTEHYAEVLSSAVDGGDTPLYGVELQKLGITHCEISSIILRQWGFSETAIDGVLCHHSPESSVEGRTLAELLHIANFICNNQGITNGTPVQSFGFSDSAWEELGLSLDDSISIIESVRMEAEKSPVFLSLS